MPPARLPVCPIARLPRGRGEGMEWGILVILLILLFTAYVIVQETRAQMHWRGLVASGDVDAVRQLVEAEVERWRSERAPKGGPALLPPGAQSGAAPSRAASGAPSPGVWTGRGRRRRTSWRWSPAASRLPARTAAASGPSS